jgi:ABC-2 type transport system ATP-binding protein
MGVGMIITKELTKEYKSFGGKGLVAVDHINFEVENKDIFGFLGPNGAGKTTTIHMLTTVLDPTFGSAEIAGFDIMKDPLKAKAKMGIMPELPMFYDWMKAEDQLKFYAEFYGYSSGECRRRAKELIDLVGLGKFGRSKIKTFSHGMRKRLALAQSLINDPELLILDEPMGGLDPMGVKSFREMIKELSKEGITIFLSSHLLSEVQLICNRVGIINHGKIIAVEKLSDLSEKISLDPNTRIYIEAKGLSEKVIAGIKSDPTVVSIEPGETPNGYYITVEKSRDVRLFSEELNKKLSKDKIYLYRQEIAQPSLEDLFMSLTDGG